MSNNKKYWKSLEDYNNSPEFVKSTMNEFPEPITTEQFLSNDNLKSTSTGRRDFLKFLGFSVTAATLAACEAPVAKVIPYVIKPEEIYPGIANYYASSYFDGTDYASILVKTREGRPIKIEGNKLSSTTRGGTNARIQASILSLYDSERLATPLAKGSETSWDKLDADVIAKLGEVAAKGGQIRLLTSTIISPAAKQVIADFITKYPTTKHVCYDAVSFAAIAKANNDCFGKNVIPYYNFETASVIVSFGADFLGNFINPVENAKGYSKGRRLAKDSKTMSRHYQFESNLSVTGANADYRTTVKPSQVGLAVLNLYNEVAKAMGGTALNSKPTDADKTVAKAAKDLIAAKGKSLVVCGVNDPNIQCLVNCINSMLGSYGTTIDLDNHSYLAQGNDTEVIALVNDMNAGKVDALIMHGVNPVYTLPASLKFESGLKKVGLKISMADRKNETFAAGVDYAAPANHYLESWGDASVRKGLYSLQQPTINPLFKTRQFEDSLLVWSGSAVNYYTYLTQYWEKNMFPMQTAVSSASDFWNKSLHDGVFETALLAPAAITCGENCSADSKAAEVVKAAGAEWELTFYAKNSIGDGSQSNNPWLLEMPDPISKITWDNYITMSPAQMKELGLSVDQGLNKLSDKISITVNGQTIVAPVAPQPGQKKGTIGLALGYGHTAIGKAGNNVGVNAYPALGVVNGFFQYSSAVQVGAKTGEQHLLACTQSHHTMMDRPMVFETSLGEYQKNGSAGIEKVTYGVHEGHEVIEKTPAQLDIWATKENPGFPRPGHFWGMGIDLNSCTGCGNCIIACQSENNNATVGKKEISNSRDLYWIRIDRYYTSEMTKERAEEEGVGKIDMYGAMEIPADEPTVVFQPVMCMHCNHAPCETVCPVIATSHTNEGLNAMTYNRCLGTKYCANNCPYKVRRFNWFKYTDNPQFDYHLNDELGKMVLNPDVSVRSRGVMEKCSMCVQRIQEGKLKAKKESRKLTDGEIDTACASSCPADAIVFGDMNDPNSRVSKLKKEDRMYILLEEIDTQPSVFYMSKVRNVDEPMEKPTVEKAEGNKEEKAEA